MKTNKILVILGSIFVLLALTYVYHINRVTREGVGGPEGKVLTRADLLGADAENWPVWRDATLTPHGQKVSTLRSSPEYRQQVQRQLEAERELGDGRTAGGLQARFDPVTRTYVPNPDADRWVPGGEVGQAGRRWDGGRGAVGVDPAPGTVSETTGTAINPPGDGYGIAGPGQKLPSSGEQVVRGEPAVSGYDNTGMRLTDEGL